MRLSSALNALHHQLLNLDAREQKIGVYGIMVARMAAEKPEDVAGVERLRISHRTTQDVRVVDAIRVVRALIREHGLSQDVAASEIGEELGPLPGPGGS